MAEQPKSKLMARLRARRQTEGWVRIEVWVPKELVAKVRAYVRQLVKKAKRTTDGDDDGR